MKRFTDKTRCIALTGCALFANTGLHAQLASFDCQKASTPTEHAICATAGLGRKDIIVATYYQLLLRLKPAASGMAYREFDDRIQDSQQQWLQRDRNACGGDTDCLNGAYDRRIDVLLKVFDDNAALTFGRLAD